MTQKVRVQKVCSARLALTPGSRSAIGITSQHTCKRYLQQGHEVHCDHPASERIVP